MTLPLLPTTAVGSYPKPAYLLEARRKFLRRQISKEELAALERRATAEWIRIQEEVGLDLLVDGEQYRGDMVAYFADELEGFAIAGLVRSYGNRYYPKPVVVGPVGRKAPVTVSWFTYAQSLTPRPVKGMLTGPYTIAEWSFNEYYPTRRALVLELARAIHEEVVDLERAGARYIQIDEPAIHTRPEEEFELAREAMEIVTDGVSAYTVTHICYGDVPKIYPAMLRLAVNQLDLALKNEEFALLETFATVPFTKDIGLGVVDAHSHRVETPEEVADGIRRALRVIPAPQIYVSPDCGLKTRTIEETVGKLRAMVEGTRLVRGELLGAREGARA
ncbi:MAG: methionine synthase [Armatimonadota bacterium]|nr:methionine synthase [Armatimonadota bacterium]MDR7468262.1 methionine synthase [Armatimonadota bacterium]MDR7492472.1 methionine synthase [Armatimonadota bacterium]MDR7553856.1 methionine synthase [Armatimonadota bacterium]MDR7558523.1 methionine synthase [Armatimonadota bacterium]